MDVLMSSDGNLGYFSVMRVKFNWRYSSSLSKTAENPIGKHRDRDPNKSW